MHRLQSIPAQTPIVTATPPPGIPNCQAHPGHASEPPPPPPLLVEGNEEYEVEEILDSRMHYNRLEYLIKWKGYNAGHNSWAVYRDVHALDAIAEFHRQHPSAPRRINSASFDYISFVSAHPSRRPVDLSTNCRPTHRVTAP